MKTVRSQIDRLIWWKRSVGLVTAIRWQILRIAINLGFPEPAVWRVRPRQVAHSLQARLRGSSDMWVFEQIFLTEEYACVRDFQDDPSLVLDLGANVGFSSAYFLSAFPKAHVVAVEPDERNFAMCKANLASYGDRAMLVHGAVWSRRATLRLLQGNFRDGREWTTQVGESLQDGTSLSVQAWDVGSLIDMGGGGIVDLLKVDIEEAELAVFDNSAASWLPRVRNICIELHGKECEHVFFAALKDFDYELQHSNELTICRNLRAKT